MANSKIKIWVINIRKGDQKAFKKLFLEFYDPLCKFAWRYVRSSHIAEELVQDVFLDVWKVRNSLDPDRNIKSYLYQSVRNKAINHLNHQKVVNKFNNQIEWLRPGENLQEYNYREDSEFIKAAQQAIEDLPQGARQIYKLNRKNGLTYREIAEVLNISPRTVESQMSRALKKLRESLSEYLLVYNTLYLKEFK